MSDNNVSFSYAFALALLPRPRSPHHLSPADEGAESANDERLQWLCKNGGDGRYGNAAREGTALDVGRVQLELAREERREDHDPHARAAVARRAGSEQ
jgi:hypothetical protein